MLSEREERELGLIEKGLRDDGCFARSVRRRPPLHRRRWVIRTAIAFGLVLFLGGLMLSATELALQGVVIAGASYGWWWKVKPTSRKPAPAPPADRRWWGFPPVR